MRRLLYLALALAAAGGAGAPMHFVRPRIVGLSHVARNWVADMGRARSFFEGFLGFQEYYSIFNPDGSLHLTGVKIDDRQWIELFPLDGKPPPGGDNLYHIALQTDDAVAMHDYLEAHGVRGPGGKPLSPRGGKGKMRNINFFAQDPDGHVVEFVQYLPDGWTTADLGQHLPETRIAGRMSHAGISVANLETSLRFYRDVLGFKEFWRGSRDGVALSWVNLRVPDGNDYLELMLFAKKPDANALHTMNHFCLEVPDVPKVEAILAARTLPEKSKQPTPEHTGVNGKRVVNYFAPDGTRVEIMEDHTVSGQPAPSSTAPVPVLLPEK